MVRQFSAAKIRRLDRLGAMLSLLCMVHCAAMPLLAHGLTVRPDWLVGEGAHRWLAVGVVLVGGLSFVPGYFHHRRLLIPFLAAVGMLLVCHAATGGTCCEVSPTAASSSKTAASCKDTCCQTICGDSLGVGTGSELTLARLTNFSTPVGGLLLIGAHVLNCRMGRCCEDRNCDTSRWHSTPSDQDA